MLMNDSFQEISREIDQPFHVVEAFSSLNPKRKVLLCDHLFVEGRQAFYNTVELLWPQASAQDAKKLEKFLYSLKNRSI